MSEVDWQLLYLVLWIIASGLGTMVLTFVWRRALIPLAERARARFPQQLLESADGPVEWVALAAMLYFAANLVFPESAGGDVAAFRHHQLWRACVGTLYVNLVLSITVLAYAVTRGTVDWYADAFAQRTHTALDNQAVILFQRFAKVVFLFIALTIMFQHFDIELTGILATAGIASLAFALAAQDTLSNMMSGIILMLDRPFKRGDRITLPSGEWGDVIEIGLRSTKVLSFDQTVIVVPNAEIAKSTVVNHNAPDQKVKIRHKLGVAYGSDMHKVKRILMDVLLAHPDILDYPPQEVFFTEFGDSALDLLIVFWIKDYRDRLRILDEINMQIKDRFEAEHVEIPFPQHDVYVRRMVRPAGESS